MVEIEPFICIKMDLAINNQQSLTRYKFKSHQAIPNFTNINILQKLKTIIFRIIILYSNVSFYPKTQPYLSIYQSIWGNPSTAIISCYSPTNASDETDVNNFDNVLSSFVWHIPNHNDLTIGGDMNSQVGTNENNKFYLHNLNRNWECLINFSLKKNVP